MVYLENFLHLPDLIPLEPEEKPELPKKDEDEIYEETKDKHAEFVEHFWSGEGSDVNGIE